MNSLFKNKNLNALVLSKNLVQYALQMRVLFFSWLAYEITQKDLWVGSTWSRLYTNIIVFFFRFLPV